MTDQVKEEAVVAEKSEMDQLVDVVKSTVETAVEVKADASDVAELKAVVDAISVPSVEGLQSVEAADEMKSDILSEVEAKMAAIPAQVIKTDEVQKPMEFKAMTSEAGLPATGFTFDYIGKSVNTASNIAGSMVSTNDPFYILQEMNPFRILSTILPVTGSSFKLPSIAGISWATENTIVPNTPRTPGGSLASIDVVIDNVVSENAYTFASLEDVPAMDATIAGLMLQSLGATEATDAVTVLDAAAYTDVNSGAAAALPTAANMVNVLGNMVAALSPAYLVGARWLMSRAAFARAQTSNNTTLNFDPITGLTTIFGYPVQVCEYLDAGSTAGDKPIYFGRFDRGLVMGSRADGTIYRYDSTRPGMVTYFGEARFKHSAWDTSALVRMNIAA